MAYVLALAAIVCADEPASKAALLQALLADDAAVRRGAVVALGAHPEAVPVLVDALGDDDASDMSPSEIKPQPRPFCGRYCARDKAAVVAPVEVSLPRTVRDLTKGEQADAHP